MVEGDGSCVFPSRVHSVTSQVSFPKQYAGRESSVAHCQQQFKVSPPKSERQTAPSLHGATSEGSSTGLTSFDHSKRAPIDQSPEAVPAGSTSTTVYAGLGLGAVCGLHRPARSSSCCQVVVSRNVKPSERHLPHRFASPKRLRNQRRGSESANDTRERTRGQPRLGSRTSLSTPRFTSRSRAVPSSWGAAQRLIDPQREEEYGAAGYQPARGHRRHRRRHESRNHGGVP